jgi:hypothetical protein
MSGLFGFLGDGSCCILDECYVREQMITIPGGLANSFSPDYGRECRDWSRISRRLVLGRPLLTRRHQQIIKTDVMLDLRQLDSSLGCSCTLPAGFRLPVPNLHSGTPMLSRLAQAGNEQRLKSGMSQNKRKAVLLSPDFRPQASDIQFRQGEAVWLVIYGKSFWLVRKVLL